MGSSLLTEWDVFFDHRSNITWANCILPPSHTSNPLMINEFGLPVDTRGGHHTAIQDQTKTANNEPELPQLMSWRLPNFTTSASTLNVTFVQTISFLKRCQLYPSWSMKRPSFKNGDFLKLISAAYCCARLFWKSTDIQHLQLVTHCCLKSRDSQFLQCVVIQFGTNTETGTCWDSFVLF